MGIWGFVYLIVIFSSDSGSVWPLTERKGLTSSFGEWRSGHLHAGIDLPTLGIGEKVYSVIDGWVMRVKVSPWGYGKVVYVKSWQGEIYVYAHLSDFYSTLRQTVRNKQLRKGSYAVEIWFKEGEIPVSKGEVIAYTGRSGCSAPHLHFELRDKNNNPIDPFIRGFSVPDTIPPVIKAIRFIPMDEASKVFGSHAGRVFEPVADTVSVFVEGRVGIEIETIDKVNSKSGRLGFKESKLYKNELLIRREFIDIFSYSNYKDSRFMYDFEYRMRTGRKFKRLYAVPGNGLPFFEGGDGVITGEDRGYYTVEVYDGSENMSRLVIKLLDLEGKEKIKIKDSDTDRIIFETYGFKVSHKWYDLNKTKAFLRSGDSIAIWNFTKKQFTNLKSPDGKCQLNLNKGDKINSKLIAVRVNSDEDTTWSWEPPIPLKEKVKIKIKVPGGEKLYSLYEKSDWGWSLCSSKREGNYLVAFIDHLGSFGILKDSMPPVVSLKRKYFSSRTPLQINLWDALSGVDFYSIKTLIDGMRTVFRYDPQKKRLIFEYPEEISKGKHELKLILNDKQGNKISKEWKIVKN